MSKRKWVFAAAVMMAFLATGTFATAGTLEIKQSTYAAAGFNGGEFHIWNTTGLPTGLISDAAWTDEDGDGIKNDFQTFCLERNEPTASPAYFEISTGAILGGIDNDAYGSWDVSGSPGFDPISAATAYLYNEFWEGTLSNFDYADTGVGRDVSGRSLQRAIWELEDEGAAATNNSDTQALAWITEAVNAVTSGSWTGIGNVRVLNLYVFDAQGNRVEKQSQLVVIPLPASALMGLGLLCALGAYRGIRRRNRS